MSKLKARRLVVTCAALLFAAAALLCTAGAQEEKKKEQPAASAPAPLSVRLNVLVLDPRDRPLDGLAREDFQVLEDGAAQKVTLFERQEGPQAYGLLVDGTGSMRTEIGRVVEFGKMIVAGSGADSEGFVVRFVSSDDIKIIQEVTSEKQTLYEALDEIFIEGGQTAINDAVYLAAERLAKYRRGQSSPRRYSLVLVTDGEDRGSFYKDEKLHEKLRREGLRVFAVCFVQKRYQTTTPEKARQYMSRLAFESGGAAYFVESGDDLTPVARRILADMNANYVVGYDSTNPKRDGSKRKVQVSAGAGGGARRVLVAESYQAPSVKTPKSK